MISLLRHAVLVLAPAASVLSPMAAEHNARAMVFYDAGQLAPAVDEFHAAYRSMPDARRDRAGREQLLGSMRMTLLTLHRDTGEAAPLCRLQGLLGDHVDALTNAYPDDLDRTETRSARARHDEVTAQLAAIGPDACAPPPVETPVAAPTMLPVPAAATEPAPRTLAVPEVPPTNKGARKQLVAGGVLLPVGLVALGLLGAVASSHRRHLGEFDTLTADLATRPCTDEDCAHMRELLTATRREEGTMIALGVTGGALVTAGTVLLIRGAKQRRKTRLGLDLRHNRLGFTIAGEF